MRQHRTGVEVDIRVGLHDLGAITIFDGAETWEAPSALKLLQGMSYFKATLLLHELNIFDNDETRRTQDHVDRAYERVEALADLGRDLFGVASPTVTSEHVEAVQRRIFRVVEITPETPYSREVEAQDFRHVPFLLSGWGLTDEPLGDDLDVPASQSEAAIESKYGKSRKVARRLSKLVENTKHEKKPKVAKKTKTQNVTTDFQQSVDSNESPDEVNNELKVKYRDQF